MKVHIARDSLHCVGGGGGGRGGFPLIGMVFHVPQSVHIRCEGELDSMGRSGLSMKELTLPRKHRG